MSGKYILTFDQGTGSSRAILFDENLQTVGVEQREISVFYPQPDRVEQSPEEIFDSQAGVARQLLRKLNISPESIAGIGITNQRETVILWEKSTGRPVFNAIVWQDKRTADFCKKLKESDDAEYIRNATGLIIDSYFSASKITWILDNVSGARSMAERGELLFGTVDTWLVWNLTCGQLHITDVTNASRTMLFNIHTLAWDDELLRIFNIPKSILPRVHPSSKIYGYTPFFDNYAIPIAGIAGDQQAALFGQRCFTAGSVKNTYGTGCFMLMNTGEFPVKSNNGLLTTVAWQIGSKTEYALEGSVFIAGAAIKWLRDSMGLISSAAETETMAFAVDSANGVYVIPAFSGLGAPHWDMYARGAIVGITQATTKFHIIRATLESLAYQTRDVIEAMMSDSKIALQVLKTDGGASNNNFLMQFQSDILNCTVVRPYIVESTSLGAALLAAIACGIHTKESLLTDKRQETVFKPEIDTIKTDTLYNGWKNAVQAIRNFR